MKGSKALSTDEYKQTAKELSQRWKEMSKEDRHPFAIQAAHEQGLRSRLAQTPLSAEGSGKTELEVQVGRAGCKKLSAKRLAINENDFHQHAAWSFKTQLGDGFLRLSSHDYDCLGLGVLIFQSPVIPHLPGEGC